MDISETPLIVDTIEVTSTAFEENYIRVFFRNRPFFLQFYISSSSENNYIRDDIEQELLGITVNPFDITFVLSDEIIAISHSSKRVTGCAAIDAALFQYGPTEGLGPMSLEPERIQSFYFGKRGIESWWEQYLENICSRKSGIISQNSVYHVGGSNYNSFKPTKNQLFWDASIS